MSKIFTRFISMLMAIFLVLGTCIQPITYANTAHDVTVNVSENGQTSKGGIDKVKVTIEGVTDRGTGQQNFWSTILSEYRGIIVIVSGIATLTFILLFIVSFMKLGKSAGNPHERSNCITAIIVTGIATAGCGGVALFVGVFYNMLI